jgi:hypothetical protein
MENKSSKLWYVVLVCWVIILAVGAYAKIASVRTYVDTKAPWIKEQITKYGYELPQLFGTAAAVADAQPSPSATPQAGPSEAAPLVKGTPKASLPSANVGPATNPGKNSKVTLNVAQIVADPSLWPKKIHLKKDIIFPAVMNKQKVGELNVTAGTEVMLIQVKAEKLGVAYTPNGSMDNAGGAMVAPEDTDLVEQANLLRHH